MNGFFTFQKPVFDQVGFSREVTLSTSLAKTFVPRHKFVPPGTNFVPRHKPGTNLCLLRKSTYLLLPLLPTYFNPTLTQKPHIMVMLPLLLPYCSASCVYI